jgi:WD40 repeat protein
LHRLTISRDGRRLLTASNSQRYVDGKQVYFPEAFNFYDLEKNALIGKLPFSKQLAEIALYPDGSRGLLLTQADNALHLWDMERLQEIKSIGIKNPRALDLSSDGRLVAVSNGPESVLLLDGKDLSTLKTLPGHEKYTAGVLFTPDARHLLTWGGTTNPVARDIHPYVVNLASGQRICTLTGNTDPIFRIVLHGPSLQAYGFSLGNDQVCQWDLGKVLAGK